MLAKVEGARAGDLSFNFNMPPETTLPPAEERYGDSVPVNVIWSARDSKLLRAYFQQCAKYDDFFSGYEELDDATIQLYMLNSGLAFRDLNGKVYLTKAGTLFCCKRESIPRFQFHVHVKFQQIGEVDLVEELWGSVLYLYYELLRRLQPFSERRMGSPNLRDEKGGEKVIYEYPEVALIEALVNFLIHRDYSIDDIGYIRVFADRIEFINPGESKIPPSTLMDSISPVLPIYRRNPRLIEAMNKARFNQREGGGILRIRSTLETNGTFRPDGKLGLEIQNIESSQRFMLKIYKRQQLNDSLEIEINNYLSWLSERFGIIELRGIRHEGNQVIQLELDSVYVPLEANTYGKNVQTVNLKDVLSLGRRLVITGGPGSGKTTVLLKIAYTLATALLTNDFKLVNSVGLNPDEEIPLPIFVPLGEYARFLRNLPKSGNKTLANFISSYLLERQISFNLPLNFFENKLRGGDSVILLLDGLDEVANETERVIVRQAIENLVAGRNKIRIVVTARSAAYKGRTALGKNFREVQVSSLHTNQVENLIRKAYSSIYPSNEAVANYKAQDLIQAIEKTEQHREASLSEFSKKLVDSPLMVRMFIIVHVSERHLPANRAEVYKLATDAILLPTYSPDVEVAEEIGSLIGGRLEVQRDLIQHLAFHMHKLGPEVGREIGEIELRQLLNTENSYVSIANEFIAVTRLRGTLLEEQLGTYQFIHLAFQEYLTARYLAEVIRERNGLSGIISFLAEGPILDSWWREPILLTVEYLNLNSPRSALRLLESFVNAEEFSSDIQLAFAEIAAVVIKELTILNPKILDRITTRVSIILNNSYLVSDTPRQLQEATQLALNQIKN